MLLIEKPNAYIAAQVPMIEIGTASAGMMRRRHLAQEQEDHHDDQHDRDEQRLLHVADRLADRDRAVVQHFDVDRRRHLRPERRQPVLDRVHHRDRVGVGLTLDRQHDRALDR